MAVVCSIIIISPDKASVQFLVCEASHPLLGVLYLWLVTAGFAWALTILINAWLQAAELYLVERVNRVWGLAVDTKRTDRGGACVTYKIKNTWPLYYFPN